MAQKVCHIAVPLVKGKPDHIVPFTGILHHEGGFAIARIGMNICKTAAGGAIFSVRRGLGTIAQGTLGKEKASSGFSAVSGLTIFCRDIPHLLSCPVYTESARDAPEFPIFPPLPSVSNIS